MLTCVYHPIDAFRVVEEDEADLLMASGVWFDSPLKAELYRLNVEDQIKNVPKVKEPKAKLKGKNQ